MSNTEPGLTSIAWPSSITTRKEPEIEPTEKQRDDLNVDAVFAKLKTIGGKKAEEE